jgi:hypothetical protein
MVLCVIALLVLVDGHGSLFFKPLTVRLDKFDCVDDHFEATAIFAFIGFPFTLVQISNNGDASARMQILFRRGCILVETNTFDPSGLVSTGFECQGKRCDGIALATKEDFRVVAEIACQNELVNHGMGSFRVGLNWDLTDICEIGMIADFRY